MTTYQAKIIRVSRTNYVHGEQTEVMFDQEITAANDSQAKSQLTNIAKGILLFTWTDTTTFTRKDYKGADLTYKDWGKPVHHDNGHSIVTRHSEKVVGDKIEGHDAHKWYQVYLQLVWDPRETE